MKATLAQLEYIVALDTHRHFAKAAEKCFITQPTLSMQIHKLEEALGVKIFDRSKQPVVPTDVGAKVLTQARRVLNEARRLEEVIEDEKRDVAGELRIGIIPTLAPYLLPLFVSSFMQRYPAVKIHVQELLTHQVIKHLKDETIDVGIVVSPVEDSSIREVPIFYEKFFAYANDETLSHDLPISGDVLHDKNLWLLNEGHCFREQVLNICQNRNSTNILDYQSGSLESLKKMVDKQGGVTLLPELATLDLSEEEKENLISFKRPTPFREVSLVMTRDFLKRRIVEALQKEILDNLPEGIRERDENQAQVIKWK